MIVGSIDGFIEAGIDIGLVSAGIGGEISLATPTIAGVLLWTDAMSM